MRLILVSDEELEKAKAKDFQADADYNAKSNSWVVSNSNSRKWLQREDGQKVKKIWGLITKLSEEDFNILCEYLKDALEPPYNSKIGVMSRAIKYRMTPKQRHVCYSIMQQRVDSIEENEHLLDM